MTSNWDIIIKNTTKQKVREKEITSLINKMVVELKNHIKNKKLCEVSVLFCGDKLIHKLNLQYRKKDKPTDVLSFASLDGEEFFARSLGDIVISLQTAKKQAKEYGTSFNEEVIRLLTHSMLHLVGFDHENVSKQKQKQMFDLQDKLVLNLKEKHKII